LRFLNCWSTSPPTDVNSLCERSNVVTAAPYFWPISGGINTIPEKNKVKNTNNKWEFSLPALEIYYRQLIPCPIMDNCSPSCTTSTAGLLLILFRSNTGPGCKPNNAQLVGKVDCKIRSFKMTQKLRTMTSQSQERQLRCLSYFLSIQLC
jgi:hypothetical protein